MGEITAALVKELREKSGAGMMDCKKALAETGGDLDGAVDWLRKKGLAAAAKKADRVAAEGLVSVVDDGTKAVVVEVNAETDFVARNETFQAFVKGVAQAALGVNGDIEALRTAPFPGGEGRSVDGQVTNMIATIGENMSLRRSSGLSVSKGVVATYLHNAVAPGVGKIGVLVALDSEGDVVRLGEVGRQIAMHVAAASPLFLDKDSVDTESLKHERDILADQARASGKPEEIIDKMVEGRLRKYYEEVCLLEQLFVMDNETRISAVIANLAKELGTAVTLTGFVRFQLGEGIAKKENDFAAEVAAAAKG